MSNTSDLIRVLVIHGPNLNMLGTREPEKYGNKTLPEINSELTGHGQAKGITIETFQSNIEGEIVTRIQEAVGDIQGLIINPAAYTHTSVAIRDAILLLDVPVVEVHLSNIYKRETFRHKSFVSDIATGQISGLGDQGYHFALSAIARLIGE